MFMNCEQKYHFPIGRRQKNNHCCSWIVNKVKNSAKSALKVCINCRNANKSNTIKDICLTCVHCWRTRDVDCILSGVQKSILFRGNFLVMRKSILFRKKIFRSSSSKKHFVSQAKNIYGTGALDKKSVVEKIDS